MAFPPSNKKLVITFVQSTVSGLLIALVLQSSPLAKSSKLQPNCNVVSTMWKKSKIENQILAATVKKPTMPQRVYNSHYGNEVPAMSTSLCCPAER